LAAPKYFSTRYEDEVDEDEGEEDEVDEDGVVEDEVEEDSEGEGDDDDVGDTKVEGVDDDIDDSGDEGEVDVDDNVDDSEDDVEDDDGDSDGDVESKSTTNLFSTPSLLINSFASTTGTNLFFLEAYTTAETPRIDIVVNPPLTKSKSAKATLRAWTDASFRLVDPKNFVDIKQARKGRDKGQPKRFSQKRAIAV